MIRCFAALALAAVVGCGGPRVAPVSGRVTAGGKALPDAMVIFEPLGETKAPGPGSQGKTDADGRYSLKLMTNDAPGAIVGKHRVSITAYEGGDAIPSSGSDMKFRKRIVPEEFNSNSKLTFDVLPAGTKDAHFDLPAAK